MRILFLTLYPKSVASPRYRVHQFLPYLREAGHECEVACPFTEETYAYYKDPARGGRPFWYHLHELKNRLRQILQAAEYDVVLVQKALMSAYVLGLERILHRKARRLIYDIDDAVHLAPPHPLGRPWRLIEDRAQIRKIATRAACCLVGNAWLKSQLESSDAKTRLFPTVVDTERFRPPKIAQDAFRIGWMGGPSTSSSLLTIREALCKTEAEVVLIGANPGLDYGCGAAILPWKLETEVADLQGFSIGIMPLEDIEWNKGKCALKAIQYMACGLPCVASPVGAIQDIIINGENGILAKTESEWRDAFALLRDPKVRSRMGAAGRETVLKKYSLEVAAPKLLSILERSDA